MLSLDNGINLKIRKNVENSQIFGKLNSDTLKQSRSKNKAERKLKNSLN